MFHGDPNVVGASLSLNGRNFQVIGVTPSVASESARVDVYVPLNQSRFYGTLQMTQRLAIIIIRASCWVKYWRRLASGQSGFRGHSTKSGEPLPGGYRLWHPGGSLPRYGDWQLFRVVMAGGSGGSVSAGYHLRECSHVVARSGAGTG